MSVGPRRALREVRKNFSSLNWWRNRVFVPYVVGTATRLHPSYPGYDEAVRVMDEDWDTLVVLDACRADYFQKVVDLDQFDSYKTRVSLGSHSSEWTRRNFQGREFGDTVYVSANPHTSLEAGDSFHEIVELWDTDTDEDAGVVLPVNVRDAATEAYENYPDKRLIVHFMQPHGPFVGSDLEEPYESEAEHWRAYEQNLEYVLPYVDDILDAIPGKTIITADHGQMHVRGLKARLGLDGHKAQLRFPGLVEVPWAEVTNGRREIRSENVTQAEGNRIEDRLEQLGYL